MFNQVEIDIEHHVLTQTKKLTDNTFEKIFSRNPRNESRMFTYNCHLCGVASLPGERALQTHITGRKHQQRLVYDYVPDAEQFRTPLAPKMKTSLFPGEPAPPGYEDEVNTVSFLEPIANKQSKPLIGLEYVVELTDNKAKEPFYVCTLCDKRCDPRNIIAQITSHRHRMKYLESHFSLVMKMLNLSQKFNLDMKYREEVLSSIAEKIEARFKRLKPHISEFREFERNKTQIVQEIKNKKHFSEKDWPDCEKFLLENVKSSNIQEFESVSSESEDEFNDMRNPHVASRSVRKTRSRSPGFKVSSSFIRVQPDSTSERRKILTPRELNEQSNAKMQVKYVLEKYKASVEIAVKEEEKKFKEYEKNPEKHSLYSEEWKAFWSRRYKELIALGKDAASHDYKPEWIAFWTKRMKDLHKGNIAKIKTDFRKKLGLTQEAVRRIESSPSNSQRTHSRSISPRRHRKRSESPIKISDDSDDARSNEPRNKKYRSEYPRKSEERSRSRFSEDSPYSRHSDYRSKEAYESSYYLSRNRDYERSRRSKSPEIIDDGPVNVISVCRLLSALEGELGLLAKTVIDLLGKAVAIEKLKPNSADELLLNTENCNILETVKEKLKGVLSANLIAPNKIIAVKRAVQNIATLLHDASRHKPSNSNAYILKTLPSFDDAGFREPKSFDSIMDPETSAKLEIAKAITASLLEQGRNDVSAEELEALVESFMAGTDEDEASDHEEKQDAVINFSPKTNPKPDPSPESKKPAQKETGSSGLENLTDEDLQTLLRNFADLTSDEQSHLIAYLSKIEQTNPARVEKLRKYVNIGDDPEIDDKCDENLDMDLAAGVSEVPNKTSLKKSPEQIKQDLSDDEYDDDAIAKTLGMNGLTSNTEGVNIKVVSNSSTPSSALKDNLGLADSLMSSLMQSSMPPQVNRGWEMAMPGLNLEMTTPYYQHPQMAQYQGMFDPQMNMAMNMGLSTPFEMQAHSNGSRSGASDFFRKAAIPKEFAQARINKKRFENTNNRQLTGSGRARHNR